MPQLPSYQDAISRLDWLELAAPYVSVDDLVHLCPVSRRFHKVFAQRLWSDPLRTVRLLGLKHSDAPRSRPSTLALVTTLDLREFAKANTSFWSDNNPRSLSESLKKAPKLFPSLRCILLDGHTEADPASLVTSRGGGDPAGPSPGNQPLALSIPDCDVHLPATFFDSDYVRHLIYLDISGLPGSLQPLFTASRGRDNASQLRILKIRRRELTDAAARELFDTFNARLWSLDLSDNSLSDSIVDSFVWRCFSSPSLRSDTRFYGEGTLTNPSSHGSDSYGPFELIHESRWSGSFSHPERYFADTPVYSAVNTRGFHQEDGVVRSDGRGVIRKDTADYIKTVIAGDGDQAPPDPSNIPHLSVCRSPFGITHLNLTGNRLTSFGIGKLIRISSGQLEDLAFDAPLFQPTNVRLPTIWHKTTTLYGILGLAHVFRPVISSNLRVLRIHHSLVTQVLTIESPDLSTMARLWIAETVMLERAEMAYPEAFEPDMNSRLTSITLTNIPRRSAGSLTLKLLEFIKLAATQEQAIRQATSASSAFRSPVVLTGLRHIRLEFEADPIEDPAGWSTADDLDAEDLMHMDDDEGFSFFEDENKSRSQPNSHAKPELPPRPAGHPRPGVETGDTVGPAPANSSAASSGRLQHAPYSSTTKEHITHTISWNGQSREVQVWIGSGVLGPNPAVNAYMLALRDPNLRQDGVIGPVTPAHVKAGAPVGELLYYAAWDSMVMPPDVRKPGRRQLHGMHDVIDGLKRFRQAERVKFEANDPNHCHWGGKLEVATQASMAHYRSARYWR